MYDYTPNERIVDRAVTIWKRALANPVYRNTRPEEGFEHVKNEILNAAIYDKLPKNNTSDVLDRFGEALKPRLMNQYESPHGKFWKTYLNVDYHPDQVLADAAKEAGLDMPFPLKTNMGLTEADVSFSMGYGAPRVYHYPLSDGWLVTTLCGAQQDVKELVIFAERGGRQPFFVVEPN